MNRPGVVIVGAGQAGCQTAVSLRQANYDGPITLVGDEPHFPYQRPPLTKAYLRDGDATALQLRNREFYQAHRIDLMPATRVEAIDREGGAVELSDGQRLPFAHLVLATGSRNRQLSLPGLEARGVLQVRTLEDADLVREHLRPGARLVVIGAGFIGLELASVARAADLAVTVVEIDQRLMRRAVSEEVSAFLLRQHRQAGIEVMLGASVSKVISRGGKASAVVINGSEIPTDFVVVAAGVVPNTDLAAGAGLEVANGIVVDATLCTADARIHAIGDCAAFPAGEAGARIRVESVQNAVDQAKCVAASITGHKARYAATAWFWSDQGANKLQIAGLTAGADYHHVHVNAPDKLAVYCFRGGRLLGAETVNSAVDHLVCRKALDMLPSVELAQLEAVKFDLRRLLPSAGTRPYAPS